MFSYEPQGTCSTLITLDIQDGVIRHCAFEDGCSGNAQGLSRLVVGRTVEDVIALLRGIECQNGTSCPDQLTYALEAYQSSQNL